MDNTSSPVLVTGATGYVAGWIVKRLLEEGITVHASIREPNNRKKTEHLDALSKELPGKIKYFKSDLLKPGSYAEAMRNCSIVFHTASPFTFSTDDPKRDLIDPALKGTNNVLNQAVQTDSVKRVVLTSSCAAIYGDNIDLERANLTKFTEESWNTSSSLDYQPYLYSKVLAEKEAWRIANSQENWDLVVINPSVVVGPSLNSFATSESFSLIKRFGDGTMRMGALSFCLGAVDVRDVAEAHFKAGFRPSAKGRYIISGHNTNLLEFGQVLKGYFGDTYPFPSSILPKPLAWLIGPLLSKTITRRFIGRNIDYPLHLDNTKSIKNLDMEYRPLTNSLIEMFQQIIEEGHI